MTVTQSESAPLVIIVGATGNQGGSVLRNLVESDKEYRIRALSRDGSKPSSQKIKETGAEIFEVDIRADNKEGIVKAFAGADIVFGVTNFWEHFDASKEVAEGKAMVDAAIEAGVGLFIFAGLPGPNKLFNGKFSKVLHCHRSKATIDDYGRSKASETFNYRTVQAAYYYSVLSGAEQLKMFQRGADGAFYITLPVSEEDANKIALPFTDTPRDLGLYVRAVIEHEDVRKDSRPVLAQSDAVTVDQLREAFAQATGQTFKLRALSVEDYVKSWPAGTPPFILDAIVDQFRFHLETGYWGGQDHQWTEQYLARKPTSLVDWLKEADLSYYSS